MLIKCRLLIAVLKGYLARKGLGKQWLSSSLVVNKVAT